MSESLPRLVGVLPGDIQHDPATRIKYGLFFEALKKQFPLINVYDASLQGAPRIWNAIQVFHPNPSQWRKRFWSNMYAYQARSRIASKYLKNSKGLADIGVQVSVLFDANWHKLPFPTIIYVDYTAKLSALRPEAGRSPFNKKELDKWLDVEQKAYQRASHVFTRAQFVRDSIIYDYGISSERVTAVGGGINFPRLPEARTPSEKESPVVLFIGRDFYRKGGDLLLKAFSLIRAKYHGARLILLTRDPIPASYSLDGVEVVSKAWDRSLVEESFARANIFVLPSRLETWGDVLLEAMVYGLPCIGINEVPMAEIIEDEKTGLLAEPESVESLHACIIKLIEDDGLRGRITKAAREYVENNFTWDHVIKRMAPVIQKIGVSSKGDSFYEKSI